MTLAASGAWQTDWKAQVVVTMDDTWKADIAQYISDHVTSLLVCNGVNLASNPAGVFTWGKAAFQSALTTGTKENFASAWETAALASTMVVAPLSYIGATPAPATQWSVVASTIITPDSVAAGKAKILADLSTIQNVMDAGESTFPVTLRAAFLLLKVTIAGTNSVTPTPAALNDANRGLM